MSLAHLRPAGNERVVKGKELGELLAYIQDVELR